MSEDQWYEPMRFDIEVIEVKSACRVDHKTGETFQAEYRTPDKPICSEAYIGMYPLLVAMRLGGDMRLLGKKKSLEAIYTCPSRVVRFLIRGIPRCNRCGKEVEKWDDLERINIRFLETVCKECFRKV
ncbi:MAG: TIGR04076 family protein [Candidatus Hodarchaeota archaeon]